MSASDVPDARADAAPPRLQRLGDAMEAFLRFQALGPAGDRERFLHEHAELRDLLEPLFAAPAADEEATSGAPALGPASCLGDYRILREIGRGGMGTVYEAEQRSLQRRVALKVLHQHLAWSPRSIERFRREAGAASRLRHPGLVPIHEVGEWRGLHYFSMEFVAGTPLNERLHDERLGVRSDVGRAAEAAELVARIADALQHAHEQGLVHRDVKPHNVMVCPDGSVRLLDFGLAASTEASDVSATGGFLGTAHYCSPELVGGRRVGPPADVFALGVTLYELITRQRPFVGATTQAVLASIEAGTFVPLRRLAPTTPRDLETICHKALERRPEDRYPDAGQLAADLHRFLRIEPIQALPPSAWTHGIKWVRRHRMRVALIATSAALVLGAPIAWALHLQGTNRVIEQERATLDQAEELGFRSIEQTLAMLGEQLDRQPGPGARHEPRVDELVQLCENFLALRGDAGPRRARLAKALWAIAGIYSHLGRPAAALAACERSRQLLLAGPARDAAGVQRQLGLIQKRELQARQLADPGAGEAEFAQAIAYWRPLATAPQADAETIVEYADTLLVRARNLADRPERRRDAGQLLREALTALAPEPLQADARAASLTVRCEAMLGHVLLHTGRPDEALHRLQAAIERIDRLPADAVLGTEKTLATTGIGHALMRLGRRADAETALRAAIDTATTWLQDWPGSTSLRRSLLQSRVLLGSQLLTSNKVEAAETVLREAMASLGDGPAMEAANASWMDRSVRADLDIQLAACILLLGDAHGADGDDAAARLRHAIGLLEPLVQEHPTQLDFRAALAVAWNSLASLANERRDHVQAIDLAARAIAQQQQVLQVMPRDVRARSLLAIPQGHLAYGLAHLGRFAAAMPAAREAVANAGRQTSVLRMAAHAATLAARDDPDATLAMASGELAVEALAKIAEVSPKEARHLLADARFASLRDRADFQDLLRRMENR